MTFASVLDQPHHGGKCVCSEPLGLYIVRGEERFLCARCTRDRIRSLSVGLDCSPFWVVELYEEVTEELRSRELVRSWSPLIPCSDCGRLFGRASAKYPARSGHGDAEGLVPASRFEDGTLVVYPPDGIPEILPPLCVTCYETA